VAWATAKPSASDPAATGQVGGGRRGMPLTVPPLAAQQLWPPPRRPRMIGVMILSVIVCAGALS
jgi:hypothetical protein